jgi:acetate kinase
MNQDNKAKILVINAGSSSFKYQALDADTEERLCQGLTERIGGDSSMTHKRFPGTPREEVFAFARAFPDHAAGMREMARMLQDPARGGVLASAGEIAAIGHRVVLGGPGLGEALVDEDVKRIIRDYSALSPLHNPANLAGIEVMEKVFPGIPNVAVFDTGFHATMPDYAYTYAIPVELARKHRIRRYGFHGTSHRYVAGEAAGFLGRPLAETNLITCHLGNGCSVSAIREGRCVDTSMGMTPLEGLIMGTRSGSIDPAILTFLMQAEQYTARELDDLLNKRSGLKGLCGSNDLRDLLAARAAGDRDAALAFAMFTYSIRKYVGAYLAVLGRADGLVFTGGIGENSPEVRAEVCRDLEGLGIAVLPELNAVRSGANRCISPPDSRTRVLVIPTDEEKEIARAALRVLGRRGSAD